MKKKPCFQGRKILAVLAHPDDETFGMGGTLAYYARYGAEVFLICATRGEVGEIDAIYMEKYKSPACLRTQELKQAAEILGIKKVIYLNYRDSGMPGSPDNLHPMALAAQAVDTVASKVAEIIREIKPEVVITFDPIGGYKHPDHIAIHKATVQAFQMAGEAEGQVNSDKQIMYAPSRLYFHIMNRTFLRLAVFVLGLLRKDPHHYGRNKDIDIADLASVDFPTHVRINYKEVASVRAAAAACHASQGGGSMSKGLQGLVMRLAAQKSDAFMQAYPPVEGAIKVKRDLFD
ncbi:MAG: PIG-L family deacetylase [Anaerolineaceae bacterium]|nr:PIG-L family deacetylase [Anaerolineaceae bacterium]